MIASLIIVFREILEAALVIGVVAAAVQGLPRRGLWLSIGIGLGVAGAVAVAASIGALSSLAEGNGQELFAATVLFAAGALLAWHNVWMAQHGRELAGRMRTLGSAVLGGSESLWVLVGVTALAVMREGSEIALFLYSMAASGVNRGQILGGGALGLAAGVAAGLLLFAGLSRIPVKRLFQASGLIILFIAAGMIARGAQFLVQAGLLPPMINRVWDSSWLIPGNGLLGRSLEALVGYTPAPSLAQLLVWATSLAVISALMLSKGARTRVAGRAAAALLLGGCSVIALLLPGHCRAGDYQVYAPYVVKGENEVEARAFVASGADSETGAGRGFKVAAGRGLTNVWATELYAEAEQEYRETLKLEEFEWENRFQLTPQGRYWLDIGLLNENELPRFADDPYQIALGPDFEHDIGRLSMILDLLAVRQFGHDAAPGTHLEYRAHVEYRWRRAFSPFLEAYGGSGVRTIAFAHPRHELGPGVTGQLQLGGARSLRWAAALLVGLTRATARDTLLVRAEYEFY